MAFNQSKISLPRGEKGGKILVTSGVFYIQKFSQFDEFVSDFALHRRLTTESTNTCSSPETWKISQTKVIKILQKTMKTTAKLCKSHERNLINIKATDKFPSLNNFVIFF